MGIVSPGFRGRPRSGREKLPPGQYLVTDFPVLSGGPTPQVNTGSWEFRLTTETGEAHTWDWPAFQALPAEEFQVDLHCVTKWSKLHTTWRGVSLDTLLAQAQTSAEYALARSYGGYTTNLPLADCWTGRRGWPSSTAGAPWLRSMKAAPAVFICGPTGFVEAAASLLVKAGHDASVIKTERFGPSGGQA